MKREHNCAECAGFILFLSIADWEILLQGGAVGNYADRAVVNSAVRLEEAWAWGFDVDTWRAHLNGLTWPEVSTNTLYALFIDCSDD